MAVSCSIVRDENNQVVYVVAPNGARSTLFDNLAQKFESIQEGLPAWLVTKTKPFKERVSNPQLNKHRAELLNGLNGVGTKQPTINIVVNGNDTELDIDNLEFTNLTSNMGPNAFNTLTAYARPVEGGEVVKLGRIRYKVKGPTIEIDSSLLAPLITYDKGKMGSLKGLGIGSKMYTELFKHALRNNLAVTSSGNLSPDSKGLWNKLTNLGLARLSDNKFILNSFPSNFDENGEIDMPSVLDFIDREGVGSGFTIEDELLVRDNMLGLDVRSSEDFISRLKLGFFPEGYFKPTRDSLSRTNMYTSEEITDLLTSEDMLEKAREFIYKLETLQEPILNDVYLDETFLVVKDGTKNEIGKFRLDNPYIIEQRIVNELGGIEERSEFEEAMLDSDAGQVLLEGYADTMNTKDDMFFRLSKLKPIGELTIEENTLVPITTRTREHMEQTLTEPTSIKLERDLDFLASLDDSMWRTSPNEITTLINSVTKQFTDIGLDATNLLNIAKKKPLQATKDFLTAARAFAIDSNTDTFDRLVNEYDEYFNTDINFKYKKSILPAALTKDNTYFIEAQESGISMFANLGVIPVGNNLFKRVAVQNKEELIDAIMNYMYSTNGYETILPKEAFFPAGFDEDGSMNMSKMQDKDNELALRESVSDFVASEVNKLYIEDLGPIDNEELQKYVIMFNYYNKSNQYNKFDNTPKMSNEINLMYDTINNIDYLATDFLADFNKKIINEKLNKTKAYTEFYSNFKFTRTGLDLVNNDPISLSNMRPYLAENQDLVNYFRTHKGRNPLTDVTVEDPIRDKLFMRNYYSNYPTALKPFTGDFSVLSPTAVAAKSKDSFIRTSRGIYEFIEGVGRLGIYGKLETNQSQFKEYDLSMAPPVVENTDILKKVDANIQDVTQIKNLYDEAEAKRIDDNYDNC